MSISFFFYTSLYGIWLLLNAYVAAFLLRRLPGVLFLSVFTAAAHHPSGTHVCMHGHSPPWAPAGPVGPGARLGWGGSCREARPVSPLQRRTWSGVGRVHGGSSCWGRNCDFLFALFLKHSFFFLVLKVIQVLCNKITWGKTIRIIIPPAPRRKRRPRLVCWCACLCV